MKKTIQVVHPKAPTPLFVSRRHAPMLFPGLNSKTLANLASQGKGPRYFKMDRLIFYRISDLIDWITSSGPIHTEEQRT